MCCKHVAKRVVKHLLSGHYYLCVTVIMQTEALRNLQKNNSFSILLLPCTVYRGQILGRNPDKSLKSFFLAIQSHLYCFALKFLFLLIHATSFSFFCALLYTVKENGGKPDRNPHPLPYGLRNPYRNLMSGKL